MNPPVDVPFCMLGSLIINGILGFAFLLALLFCMGDVQTALESSTGYPIIQIFYSVTGSPAASSAMTSTLVLMAGMATIPLLASTGRMLWSLANDRGMSSNSWLHCIPCIDYNQHFRSGDISPESTGDLGFLGAPSS